MSNFIINNETNLLYPVKCDSYANIENAIASYAHSNIGKIRIL